MSPYASVTTTIVPREIADFKKDNILKDVQVRHDKDIVGFKTIFGTYPTPLKWGNIILLFIFHVALVWGLIAYPYSTHVRLMLWGK